MARRTRALTANGGAPSVPGAAPEAAPKRPRGERRKLATRASLLNAAFKLMAERGIDAIAIRYRNQTGRGCTEIAVFDTDGQVARGWGLYDAG